MSRLSLFLILCFVPCYGAFQTDYFKALEVARDKEVPLLVFFNGSDWSGLAMKMKNEIFASSDFEETIGEQLICVEVDFPRHHELSGQEMEQNQKLFDQFEISSFPALVLIDYEQREIARLGYLPESGKTFAKELLAVLKSDEELHAYLSRIEMLSSEELIKGYKLAVELQQASAIAQFLEVGSRSLEPAFFLIEQYCQLVENKMAETAQAEEIRARLFKTDPNNEQGYLFTIALLDFQARSDSQEHFSPEEVIAPLKDYLVSFGKQDEENRWRVEMMIAQFYLDQDEWTSALTHAQTAYNCAPDEQKAQMEHSLHYIKEQAAQVVKLD